MDARPVTALPGLLPSSVFYVLTVLHDFAFVSLLLVGVWTVRFSPALLAVFAAGSMFSMVVQELGLHRYFSHRAFSTSRVFQLVLALLCCCSPMRGPIFWAWVHRHHHKYTDKDNDYHTPRRGWGKALAGWMFERSTVCYTYEGVGDLVRVPELVLLDKFWFVPFWICLYATYRAGEYLQASAPALQIDGPSLLVWGGMARIMYANDMMGLINVLAHSPSWGYRNFDLPDLSTNIRWLSILSAGVGLHNNHHRAPAAAFCAVLPHEIDLTGRVIRLLERLGIVWKPRMFPPEAIKEAMGAQQKRHQQQ